MNLSTPVGTIPRIGTAYEKRLKNMGIATLRDLLFHFPRAYQDLSSITPIKNIKEGGSYCVTGNILDIQALQTYRKRMHLTEAVIEDKTGNIKVVWFNQPYLKNTLKKGDSVFLAGKVTRDKYGIHLSSPTYEKLAGEDMTHTGRIIPVYQEAAGVSSRWLRSIIKPLLDKLPQTVEDPLPGDILPHQKPSAAQTGTFANTLSRFP